MNICITLLDFFRIAVFLLVVFSGDHPKQHSHRGLVQSPFLRHVSWTWWTPSVATNFALKSDELDFDEP